MKRKAKTLNTISEVGKDIYCLSLIFNLPREFHQGDQNFMWGCPKKKKRKEEKKREKKEKFQKIKKRESRKKEEKKEKNEKKMSGQTYVCMFQFITFSIK